MRFDIPREHRNASGIYAIVNLINHKIYVGSTVCFKIRYNTHKSLKARCKPMKLLAALKKYGVENFAFTLLELCERPDLIATEQKWIDKFDAAKKGYNLSPTAMVNRLGCKLTDEQRERLSKARKASGYKPTREAVESMKANLSKAVFQFDFVGNIVAKFASVKNASESVGVGIPSVVNACKTRKLKIAGFYWRYASEFENVPSKIEPPRRFVSQFDLQGNFICNYPDSGSAAKATGLRKSDICSCASGRQKRVGSFYWTENGKLPNPKKPPKLGRTIISIQGDVILEHKSIAAAARTCGVSEQPIRHILKGKIKTVRGIIFKDKEAA